MITIIGNVAANETSLIDDLKKFFEADTVVLDWNDEPLDTNKKNTLAITNKQPPYKTPCSIITLKIAQKLMDKSQHNSSALPILEQCQNKNLPDLLKRQSN